MLHGGAVEGGVRSSAVPPVAGTVEHMLGGQHGGFGGEDCEGLAAVSPGDAGYSVGNVGDVARAGCAAHIDRGADVVVADAGQIWTGERANCRRRSRRRACATGDEETAGKMVRPPHHHAPSVPSALTT
jgi:hypothetical protein